MVLKMAGTFVKDADTQLVNSEIISENITINTEAGYQVTLKEGARVYYLDIDGQKTPAIYIEDNKFYGLDFDDEKYIIFELIEDESMIAEIEEEIANIDN